MPFFAIFWLHSWVSFLLNTHNLVREPNLASPLPAKVLSVFGKSIEESSPSVSLQARSGIWPYEYSLVAWSSSSFESNKNSGDRLSNQVKSAVESSPQPKAIADLVCTGTTEKDKSPVAKNTPLVSSAVSSNALKPGLHQRIWQGIGSLFGKSDRVKHKIKKPIIVVRVANKDLVDYTPTSENYRAKLGFWLYSKFDSKRAIAQTTLPKKEWSQVLVNGRLIAEVPERNQADLIAESLNNVFADPNGDADRLQPTLVQETPGGALGDRLLFVIDDALSKQLDRDRELVAIDWINNLRVALGAKPLTLVEAQTRMYNLVDTEQKITGVASWYGGFFHGRLTANGERYNQYAMTAAHKTLPFNTFLKVTNMKTGDTAIVRINDRGPYIPPRSLDLSLGAARCVNSEFTGVVPYEAVMMRKG